ncbi:MAG: NAD(P)/FAD-dependent oxidoreductase [Desulfobacterales bacterium]|nr:NAD(P)/FAD-dependent oxidoreductase [Desulfobacterales bacterium]MCP4160638.1 NAD(P)/FAD-dependent oxidoreductase [Deltaproteobacteria bacterium]
MMKHIVIVGGGFAGLQAAKILGKYKNTFKVTLLDKNNHHLFQPLLYQVATAGLSQSDIAVPIRSILSKFRNISVLQGTATDIDFENNRLITDYKNIDFDYLILACGVKHSYFGNSDWEKFAPGLKTLEQAMEIRRRILSAFEKAEREQNLSKRKKYQTFVVVGGGPTGVELAGSIGEMTRYALVKDFRSIDPKLTRIILIEAGERILSSFNPNQSSRATRDLEKLGVQVWTSSPVSTIDDTGIMVDNERIETETVLWAAGISATELNNRLGVDLNRHGQIIVQDDLSIKNHNNIFVAGDQACFCGKDGNPLPCLSPVAIQQGTNIAKNIVRENKKLSRKKFKYRNKGAMATIGKSKAIADFGFLKFQGFTAWFLWLFVHIYFITGFNNRFFIFIKWCTSYITNKKGARIILNNSWRFFDKKTD